MRRNLTVFSAIAKQHAPSETDADKAYGRELSGLQKGNIQPADYRLEKEIAELTARHRYAQKGAERFRQLIRAERRV